MPPHESRRPRPGGLPDVACSSTFFGGTLSFIAFQNAYNDWHIVANPFTANGLSIGNDLALLSVSRGPRINIVGATTSGIYWFRNPRLVGGNARTDTWTPFFVGGSGSQAVEEVALGTVDVGASTDAIIAASNQEPFGPWSPGLEFFSPHRNYHLPWITHPLDSTYRAVHEINDGSFNGAPYFIVGEQEQAGGTPSFPAEHPGIPSRVTMFEFQNGQFNPAVEVSDEGTHNQQTVPFDGGVLVVGANHGRYGTPYPALQAWLIQ